MKNMKQNVSKKQGGFTLLELLVVVGIMAILGGAMISSFGGQEAQAARGAASQSIAGIEDALTIYKQTKSRLPDNMESLICYPHGTDATTVAIVTGADTDSTIGVMPASAVTATAYKLGGESNVAGIGGGMGKKLAEKFFMNKLTAPAALALTESGVTEVRYAVAQACDTDAATVTAATFQANGTTGEFGLSTGGLVGIDIPAQTFESPRPDTASTFKLRGVGYSLSIEDGMPVLIWKEGSGGYNNVKLGAQNTDVLIGLGIGQASDLVGGADAIFTKAPSYGQVGKDKYAHYVALVNIGSPQDATGAATTFGAATQFTLGDGKAFVQAVVDARGDFLDEEIAEFRGQKT
jgi:prepilin-type N-terminal cleavage/methylation domain-containing protein